MGHHATNFEAGVTHEALPIDPEHDIDAKSSTIWVIGGAIVLFISLVIMVPIFLRVQDEEVRVKVNQMPCTEHDKVVALERDFLAGNNPQKRELDDVLRKMGGK